MGGGRPPGFVAGRRAGGFVQAHLTIDGGDWRAQLWHGHLARGRAPGNMGKMPMPLALPSIGRCTRFVQAPLPFPAICGLL